MCLEAGLPLLHLRCSVYGVQLFSGDGVSPATLKTPEVQIMQWERM